MDITSQEKINKSHHRERHVFTHKFPMVQEKVTIPIVWEEPGKLVLIFFPIMGTFYPIQFPSYGIVHHVGNEWASPMMSHSTRKCNKTHRMGRTWGIGNHTFPEYGYFFWYTSSHGKLFPHQFSIALGNAANPLLEPTKLVLILF